MRIKPADDIRKRIRKEYNKDPEGWHLLVGKDRENYIDSLFIHKSRMWMLKEFLLNPYKSIGYGGEIKADGEFKSNYPFGFRPLDMEQGESILSGDLSMIQEILRRKPLPLDECSPLVMEGPIAISKKPVVLSRAQEELDIKLRKSLKSLIRRKHRDLIIPYV